jgi:hypothetical protein
MMGGWVPPQKNGNIFALVFNTEFVHSQLVGLGRLMILQGSKLQMI